MEPDATGERCDIVTVTSNSTDKQRGHQPTLEEIHAIGLAWENAAA